MGDRCTGLCCKHFTLPWSPAHLNALVEYELYVRNCRTLGAPIEERFWEGQRLSLFFDDIVKIRDMVIYLGYRTPMAEVASHLEDVRHESKHRYTCKNLQPDGNCGIYATRPDMCSSFPSGAGCDWAACEWDDAGKHRPGLKILSDEEFAVDA